MTPKPLPDQNDLPDPYKVGERVAHVIRGAARLRAIWPKFFDGVQTQSGYDFASLVAAAVLEAASDEERSV